MRSVESPTTLDAIPSTAALSRARVEYRRRHGGAGDRAGSSAAASRKAEELMNEAAAERSRAMRWVLLDEARKTGIASGRAVIVSRAVRLLAAEFDVDGPGLEYRSLREMPLLPLRGQRAAEVARSAEALATRADLDGRPNLAIDSLALAVRAWQAAGADAAARSAAERHDRLLAEAREDAAAGRVRGDAAWRPATRDPSDPGDDPDAGKGGAQSR